MLLIVLLLLLCAGCPCPEPARNCTSADVLGTLTDPVELTVWENGAQVQDGAALTLERPPQGGFILFVAAGARNLHTCAARLSGEVLDPATRAPFTAVDVRVMNFDHEQGLYGFPESALNIAACPDNLGAGVAGRDGILSLELTERTGRKTSLERRVKVLCPPNDAGCACICGPNYAPGKC